MSFSMLSLSKRNKSKLFVSQSSIVTDTFFTVNTHAELICALYALLEIWVGCVKIDDDCLLECVIHPQNTLAFKFDVPIMTLFLLMPKVSR